MIQMAITYFTPFYNAMISIFKLKALPTVLGIGLAGWLEWMYSNSFLGIPIALIVATVASILYNTITGALASHHEAEICLKAGNETCYDNKKFQGKKLMYVVFKFITFFVWLFIAKTVGDAFTGRDVPSMIFGTIGLIPVVLFLLYEFISANKNIKRKYGKYPFLIEPIIKIFDSLSKKFDNMLNIEKEK